MNAMNTASACLLLACASVLAPLHAAQLGDAAAPLEIAEWIKGEPVDLAEARGKKVIVVEFWATWCGPCKVSIPHLTELQKKFANRGVVVIGVSDEEPSTVKPFVNEQGDKMNYTVAIDRNRATSAAYMEKFGQNGIPHAFVIDKEGRIAWHGHPMSGLDRVLDKLASNTFDLALERKRQGAMEKLQSYFEMAMQGAADEKLDPLGAQLLALDQELGGLMPGEKLDLAGMKKSGRFQAVMSDYRRALSSGKSETELAALEAKAQPLAPQDFSFAEFKGQFQLQRLFQDYYRAVTGRGDAAKIEALARKLEATTSRNGEMLNEIAWTLLTDERIKNRNLQLASKLALAAVTATDGKDPNALDTHARALADSGRLDEAIAQQKRAVALQDDPDKKREIETTLKEYQLKAGKKN